jgi:predicted RNA methylase
MAYKQNINKKLGQFYTKPEVAKKCYDLVVSFLQNINKIQFIEPSAGTGSFFNLLPNKYIQYNKNKYKTRLGFDIDPKEKQIEKKDFLNDYLNVNILLPKIRVVIIGNPPFGNRSSLAIKFFNKAIRYGDTVAFIVPLQFKKWSVQSKLNKEFKLIKELLLDKNSFTFNNKDYGVRCVFQIWTKLDTQCKNLRILTKPQIQHKDFEMWQYNNTKKTLKYFDYTWDFAVVRQGYYDYTKLITNKTKLNPKRQWIFFKASSNVILQRLKNLNFTQLSKNNTTVPGFGKADVIKEYVKLYN